jgi:hypothetical protein
LFLQQLGFHQHRPHGQHARPNHRVQRHVGRGRQHLDRAPDQLGLRGQSLEQDEQAEGGVQVESICHRPADGYPQWIQRCQLQLLR